MSNHDEITDQRSIGLTLVTGLYLFFFLVSASTYGNPFPFMGRIYIGSSAKLLVLSDCLICLYLFMGTMKRQHITWYLLMVYNLFEITNTIVNVNYISLVELEKVAGVQINRDGLWANNIAAALAILLLTQYIYRNKQYFSNRQRYLF